MQMTQALATAILAATSVSAFDVPHSGTQHVVSVGADKQKVYFPNHFNAAPGDAVSFSFHVGNHSVTQSSFEEPCKPLKGKAGVNSGFVFQSIENGVQFFLEINNTKPIWFYCGQADHCRSGMVGSINAPTTGNTFEKFLANAKAVKQEDIVQDGELRGGLATKFRAVDPSPVFTRTIAPAEETGAPAAAVSSTVKTYAPSSYVKTWTYTTSENNQVKTVTATSLTTAPASTVTVAVGGGADSTGKGSDSSSSSSSKAAAPAVTAAPMLAGAAMLAAAALL
ncbi:hypothetical protein VHEMI00891 [[Torrubiella] hemipterigena]|uniref:Extracellular serine-rich protein n=1 Tax=[Torrubiella] hemipterigena TaxID=1531966 RepID=A0A0A1SKI9_9HYPO|nr:hypothetical protein VHEMI00891 [[Torrubiella] hemipterigena]